VSTIKEKADAEAAAAEAEFPDETETEPGAEPVEQPDAEPDADEEADAEEQPAEEQPSGRKVKSPQERFQTAFAAFVKKAAECFAIPPAEVQVAPHPGVVGIMLPGFAEPRTHENYKRCDTCNGLGKVLTGAITRDESKDWRPCPDSRCKGQGYWSKHVAEQPAPTTGPLAVQPAAESNGEWGEAPAWMGDPNVKPAA
jgi:hypothetical protein